MKLLVHCQHSQDSNAYNSQTIGFYTVDVDKSLFQIPPMFRSPDHFDVILNQAPICYYSWLSRFPRNQIDISLIHFRSYDPLGAEIRLCTKSDVDSFPLYFIDNNDFATVSVGNCIKISFIANRFVAFLPSGNPCHEDDLWNFDAIRFFEMLKGWIINTISAKHLEVDETFSETDLLDSELPITRKKINDNSKSFPYANFDRALSEINFILKVLKQMSLYDDEWNEDIWKLIKLLYFGKPVEWNSPYDMPSCFYIIEVEEDEESPKSRFIKSLVGFHYPITAYLEVDGQLIAVIPFFMCGDNGYKVASCARIKKMSELME